MRVTYYFDNTVKNLIKDSINTFIVDNVLELGETIVGCDTQTLLEEYKTRVQRLKDFSKWILRDVGRFNFDTDSNNFTFLYSLLYYIFNSDIYETHNLSFLRIFQQVIRDNILETRDNGGDITHVRYMLQCVDKEINNIDEIN